MSYLHFISLTLMIPFSAFAVTIPVLDMEDFHDPERHEYFVQSLSEALQEWGFVAIHHTRIESENLKNAFSASSDFFALDSKTGAFDPKLSGQRGYTPGETAKGSNKKDQKEFFSIGREYSEQQRERLGYVPNIWPDDYDLKTHMITLLDDLEQFGQHIQVAFAEALDLEKDHFNTLIHEGDLLLRSIHYFPNPPQDTPWAAAHVDSNLYTILPAATGPGLQVQSRSGEWVDVDIPEGAVVINAGEMLQNHTNGFFRSSVHRVLPNPNGDERYTLVLFMHPKPTDRLDPLPSCIEQTGGIQLFPNATQKELLYERLVDGGIASEEAIQFIGKSGVVERMIPLQRASRRVMETLRDHGCASDVVLKELQNH